ncbi:hypothetical protein [Lyngbya sp. PCC 8106]|uniref:hypothetical protein n=1 Tax=Lyngbya sp. (strain PCC 8106) TaxID=313612 RepID=UPI0000EACE15|nr:hypothetical protein [Lyngbya sp. PCC 8106]EAW34802.1 hypothetical protein L8106_26307 [Lyngbya sp. PCC 8106]
MSQSVQATPDEKLLQDYYQALDAINTQHLKLLDAQLELSWHNSRKKEAYKLAQELGCNNILSLAKAENINYQTTDRIRLNNYFQNTSNIVAKLKTLVQEKKKNINAKNENITSLKETQKNELEASKINQSSILEQLKGERSETVKLLQQMNQNLESLKTQKMLYLISVVVFAVIITHLFSKVPMSMPSGRFWIPAFFTSAYFIIIFDGISIQKKDK